MAFPGAFSIGVDYGCTICYLCTVSSKLLKTSKGENNMQEFKTTKIFEPNDHRLHELLATLDKIHFDPEEYGFHDSKRSLGTVRTHYGTAAIHIEIMTKTRSQMILKVSASYLTMCSNDLFSAEICEKVYLKVLSVYAEICSQI